MPEASKERLKSIAHEDYKKATHPAFCKMQQIEADALYTFEVERKGAFKRFEDARARAWEEYKQIEQPAWATCLARLKEINETDVV